ncbi:MAG: lipoate--protein ligase family protein [Opitutaceae bacterium]
MLLHLLPDRTADAAENMALDFLMLQRYPDADHLRLRHYDWRRPACTFGYSQKIAFVRAQLPQPGLDLTRRATGGGIVDHTEDWTFCLVIPRAHPLWADPGPSVYRSIHESMTHALRGLGGRVRLESRTPEAPAGVCFNRAEINDVVLESTGAKVAGAAMKRNKRGLLFQGSIWKPLLPDLDWEAFGEAYAHRLAADAGVRVEEPGWPDFDPDEESGLIDQYASSEWIEAR